ncbi:hypothetical protein R3P38DRAFT_3255644 [Favolaschia claudopus]|uniref:RRM domain-containing protein n=1 Tax=Favolaschia claudopus TaxID=2862362 RepID=A0AAW0DNL1_9AGAR
MANTTKPASTGSNPGLHSQIKSSTLFLGPLPSSVLESQVSSLFQGFQPSPLFEFSRTKNGRNRGALRLRLEFPNLESAKKAVALHHLRPLPGAESTVILTFSAGPTGSNKPLGMPNASVRPRLIKVMPPGSTEATLYDLLCPYGPVYSVRMHPIVGGIVQFWTEADAKQAETSQAPKLLLQAFDPCTLYCTNIDSVIDACSLRTYFGQYGHVTHAHIFADADGQSQGRGTITFSQASEASDALNSMHGVEIGWKALSLSYHWLKMGERTSANQSDKRADSSHIEEAATAPAKKNQSMSHKASSKFKENQKRQPKWGDVAEGQKTVVSQKDGWKRGPPPLYTVASNAATPSHSAAESAAPLLEEPHDRSPNQSKIENAGVPGLETLQALYEAEKAARAAQELENERLREGLKCMMLQADADKQLLRDELESTKLQGEAEIELLRQRLDSAKEKSAAEAEVLRQEVEFVKLQGEVENDVLLRKLDTAKERSAAAAQLKEEELESVKLQGEAELELLRQKLDAMTRALEMAESQLKILQLERDRPIWEAAKKKREEKEQQERVKEAGRRRAAELEESRRKMQDFIAQEKEKERQRLAEQARVKERLRKEAEEKERERQRREKEEHERKVREKREKLERWKRLKAATDAEEARCQKRDAQLWGQGQWTHARALERLKIQIEEFNSIKFSETQPLTFRVIPWPVLVDPLDLDIEQIDWQAVEAFFASVKVRLAKNVGEYKALVEKVHRLFHPDKWRSRSLLDTVMDEQLRKALETAGNVVVQAMTPIWRKSKGIY